MSAVASGVVEEPETLRQRPEWFPTMVPLELAVQYSLALPLQV